MKVNITATAAEPALAPAPAGSLKLFIKNYGCQMNVYDAQRMKELLAPYGYAETAEAGEADLIILNTCHIREKADEKVFSDAGRIHKAGKAAKRGQLVAVGGCMAQAMGRDIIQRAPYVNIVFGPQTYHRLPEFIARARQNPRARVLDIDFPALEKFDNLPAPTADGPTAFVTIQEGCDKFCTYCVVPYTRGVELSRPVSHVLDEVKTLADKGVKEICLLGQNVNAYHGIDGKGAEWNLARLIRATADVAGIERIRFTTSHPSEMDNELIALYGTEPRLMPYLHLPVQAGADRVLLAMNRTHTADDYLNIVDLLRMARPDVALAGDFIVGFPGETDADFEETLTLVREAKYAQAYSFMYSARPGTPAAELPGQVPDDVKAERLQRLQTLLSEQQFAFNKQFEGRTLDILVEGFGRDHGQLRGHSPHNVVTNFTVPRGHTSESLIGRLVRVNISKAHPNSLFGAMAPTHA